MVTVKDIRKTYDKGKVLALADISLTVNKGELFGLIGPDGAGKTTLFRILTTLILPDAGVAIVDGKDVVTDFRQIRSESGYMPGRFSLYKDLTVEENLRFFATIFGTTIQQNYDLIKDIYVQLEPFKDRLAGKLSGGMKQKLALCCALIHRPKILFLDEPTTGVDAVSRKEFWEMLKRLKLQGITIMVSTPYMDEATLCERIALIQKGKILSVETPEAIVSQYPDKLYAIKADDMGGQLLQSLRDYPNIKSCNAFGEYDHITFKTDSPKNEIELVQYLKNQGFTGIEIKPARPTIEDCFIALMES